MKTFLDGYTKNLVLRIIVFALFGMGYDVIVTTIQQLLGGHLDINAIQSASTWMFLVYGIIPLVIYPVKFALKKLRIPGYSMPFIFLALFYIAEYSWATLFAKLSIEAWNYNWYTPAGFNTANGYVSFHPAIIVVWLIFVIIALFLDDELRRGSN